MSGETLLQWLLASISSLVPMSAATWIQASMFRLKRNTGLLPILVLAQTAVCAIALFGVFLVWERMELATIPAGRNEAIAMLILGQALFMTVAVPTMIARLLKTRLWVNMGFGSIATLVQALWLVLLVLLGRPSA